MKRGGFSCHKNTAPGAVYPSPQLIARYLTTLSQQRRRADESERLAAILAELPESYDISVPTYRKEIYEDICLRYTTAA